MYFLLHKLLASIDAKILFATHVKHPEKLVWNTASAGVALDLEG